MPGIELTTCSIPSGSRSHALGHIDGQWWTCHHPFSIDFYFSTIYGFEWGQGIQRWHSNRNAESLNRLAWNGQFIQDRSRCWWSLIVAHYVEFDCLYRLYSCLIYNLRIDMFVWCECLYGTSSNSLTARQWWIKHKSIWCGQCGLAVLSIFWCWYIFVATFLISSFSTRTIFGKYINLWYLNCVFLLLPLTFFPLKSASGILLMFLLNNYFCSILTIKVAVRTE